MKPLATSAPPWIQTVSGRKFPLLEPDPAAIHVEDIAHALSMLCRFNAHSVRFYSVAEHSVHVSREISEEFALLGLMHDAAEAYLGDMPGPLKAFIPCFGEIENRLLGVIAEKFGFPDPSLENAELKRADKQLLADERAIIMAAEPEPWPKALAVKNPSRIECWPPEEARRRFLVRFHELTARPRAF